MNILISGVTGFIGRHLAEDLHKKGQNIYGLARSQKKFENANLKCHLVHGDLSQFKTDLLTNLDVIIHTAGLVHAHNPKDFYDVNFESSKVFFNKLVKKFGTRKIKFVYFSSLAAAGPSKKGNFLTEEEAPNPIDHYGKSKLLFEEYLRENCPGQWEIIIIRPPMVIGPYDQAMLDLFKMVQNRLVLVPGSKGLEKTYSFVSVFDIVSFVGKIVEEEAISQNWSLYYLSYPKETTFLELHETIRKSLNIEKLRYIHIPSTLLFTVASIISFLVVFLRLKKLAAIRLTRDKYLEIREDSFCASGRKASNQFKQKYEFDLIKTVEITTKYYKKTKQISPS